MQDASLLPTGKTVLTSVIIGDNTDVGLNPTRGLMCLSLTRRYASITSHVRCRFNSYWRRQLLCVSMSLCWRLRDLGSRLAMYLMGFSLVFVLALPPGVICGFEFYLRLHGFESPWGFQSLCICVSHAVFYSLCHSLF